MARGGLPHREKVLYHVMQPVRARQVLPPTFGIEFML